MFLASGNWLLAFRHSSTRCSGNRVSLGRVMLQKGKSLYGISTFSHTGRELTCAISGIVPYSARCLSPASFQSRPYDLLSSGLDPTVGSSDLLFFAGVAARFELVFSGIPSDFRFWLADSPLMLIRDSRVGTGTVCENRLCLGGCMLSPCLSAISRIMPSIGIVT